MALIYLDCGQYDKAIDELDELLSLGTIYTPNDLKINMELEPIRKLPRYVQMIKKYTSNQDPL